MKLSKVKKIIFSSSASVYGNPVYLPIDEMHRVEPSSPYGKTKLQIENMLHDLCLSDPDWKAICFRYFNPIGAHESGLIGEEPNGVPSNLLPFISRVAAGKCQALNIYGNNYSTRDGTGIRDYIHIMDLIDGHLAGLNYLDTTTGFNIFNLGVGKGISVLEIIDAFEKANGIKINYKYSSRRLGDIDACYSNPTK
jgi:UDP-glucose 4-epimerase